jgi:hypothetical protein
MKPAMFIASSRESLNVTYAVQENLEHDVEATPWTQNVFVLSQTTLASLIAMLNRSDFALFILAPDDIATIRGETASVARDNVIFELGLFAGRLGIERCFLLIPAGARDLHLPTDLLGLTPATYPTGRQDGNWLAALGPACNRVREAVTRLGRMNSGEAVAAAKSPNKSGEAVAPAPNREPGRFARADKILPVGACVFHQKFGYGTVEIVDDDKLDVLFETVGHKRVLDRFVDYVPPPRSRSE